MSSITSAMVALSLVTFESVGYQPRKPLNFRKTSPSLASAGGKTSNSSPFLSRILGKKASVKVRRSLTVLAVTEGSAKKSGGSEEEQSVPSWAKPDSEEPPPWARNEAQPSSSSIEIPFYVYLLASAVTAIAAIGSVFEYINQRPVFGLLSSDSIFYAPLLGFFAFTGIPTSAFLWFKSVQTANKEAEEQDRRDGYS